MVSELNSLDIIRNAYKNHYLKDISEEKMYFHIYTAQTHIENGENVYISLKKQIIFSLHHPHICEVAVCCIKTLRRVIFSWV